MDIKHFILVFVLGIGFSWPIYSQQYIDIDLDSTSKAKKTKPVQQPPPTKKVSRPPAKPVEKVPPKAPLVRNAVKKAAPAPIARPTPPAPQSKLQPPPAKSKDAPLSLDDVPTAPVQGKMLTKPTDKKHLKNTTQNVKKILLPIAQPVAPKEELKLDSELSSKSKAPVLAPIPKPDPSPTANSPEIKSQIQMALNEDQPRFRNRHAFGVDYTTWYETMKMKNKGNNSLTEGNSHYFGVAFNYDFTVYREKYGFAVTVGTVTGNAQAGTKDSGDYYERRIVWTGFRGGGRLFFRANNRIDLGLGFVAQSKATKWPEEDNYTVLAQPNPQYFYYLDTRWRLNYKFELVQGFGTHLRSYALAWMLGVNYTIN